MWGYPGNFQCYIVYVVGENTFLPTHGKFWGQINYDEVLSKILRTLS